MLDPTGGKTCFWPNGEIVTGEAAARAKADGEIDRGVLDAVRYHSVGLAEWDMVGRILYAADFLEPGREFDRAGRAELVAGARFRFDLDPSLGNAARAHCLEHFAIDRVASQWETVIRTVRVATG